MHAVYIQNRQQVINSESARMSLKTRLRKLSIIRMKQIAEITQAIFGQNLSFTCSHLRRIRRSMHSITPLHDDDLVPEPGFRPETNFQASALLTESTNGGMQVSRPTNAYQTTLIARRSYNGIFAMCACALAAVSLRAAPIPTARLAPWKAGVTVGVPGGIPTTRSNIIDVTQSPYSADKTGNADASGEIQRALSAANSGDVVYLPAGTYRMNAALGLPNNVTLRGAGAGTRLVMYSTQQTAIQASVGTEWPYEYSTGGSVITGGLSQGSTTLSFSSTIGVSVGDIVTISEENDLSVPVVSVGFQSRLRKQKSVIISKSGSTVTISPGLFWTLDSTRNPRAHVLAKRFEGCGIEDLKIDLTNSTAGYGIYFQQAVRSWIKNVTMVNQSNYGIYLANCFQVEVRHCDIRNRKSQGSNGAGIMV
ncbi:MAG: glycosyl hydrolase family 28-related protein, partial [Bacteroidota bacterium]